MTGGSDLVRIGFRALSITVIATLVGCALTPEEKQASAARRAAPTAVVMKDSGDASVAVGLPKSSDGYPNFSGPLTAANIQMSDEDAADLQHKMTLLANARRAGTITEAEYNRRVEEMRQLAAQHGPDTLAEIAK